MVSTFDRPTTDAEQGLCRFDKTSVTNHMSKVWRILMWQNWIKSKTGTFDLISQHKESSNFWLLKPQRSYPATVGGLWDPEIIEPPLHHFSLIHLCDPCFFSHRATICSICYIQNTIKFPPMSIFDSRSKIPILNIDSKTDFLSNPIVTLVINPKRLAVSVETYIYPDLKKVALL